MSSLVAVGDDLVPRGPSRRSHDPAQHPSFQTERDSVLTFIQLGNPEALLRHLPLHIARVRKHTPHRLTSMDLGSEKHRKPQQADKIDSM